MKIYLALGFLLACAGAALAFPFRSVQPVQYVQPYYQQSYVQTYQPVQYHFRRRVNVVEIATVAQINPAYTSSYAPDAYDGAAQTELLAELRRLRAAFDSQAQLARTAVPAVVVAPTPAVGAPVAVAQVPGVPAWPLFTTGLQVLQAKCVACHKEDTKLPNQTFTILTAAGTLAPLTPAQKLKMIGKTFRQEMPPPLNVPGIAAVTDREEALLVDYLQ
jgi:hypothetical protein